MSTKLYLSFIRTTLEKEGLEVADMANKIALEQRAITIDQYRKAASILAKTIIDR